MIERDSELAAALASDRTARRDLAFADATRLANEMYESDEFERADPALNTNAGLADRERGATSPGPEVTVARELVYPTLETLEEDFTSDLADIEEAAMGILRAAELAGNCGYFDHYLQVRARTEAMREAIDAMETTLDLLERFPEYA
jgi:hypothetical protein